MARKKSFADGFTIESLIGEGQNTSSGNSGMSGPGPQKGTGRGFRGGPTLNVIDYGEEMAKNDSSGDIYPPVYGDGNRQLTQTKKKLKTRGANGYKPSASDLTNGPKS